MTMSTLSKKLAALLVQFRYNRKTREETARELDVLAAEARELEAQRDTAIRLLREHAWENAECFDFLKTVTHVDSPASEPFPEPPTHVHVHQFPDGGIVGEVLPGAAPPAKCPWDRDLTEHCPLHGGPISNCPLSGTT